jgi:hypothetical protein
LRVGVGEQGITVERSSDGGRGFSTDGRSDVSVTGGVRGLTLAANADSDRGRRVFEYRQRLTPNQLGVFDALLIDASELGRLPDYAERVMAPYGPWPDPFDGGGSDGA